MQSYDQACIPEKCLARIQKPFAESMKCWNTGLPLSIASLLQLVKGPTINTDENRGLHAHFRAGVHFDWFRFFSYRLSLPRHSPVVQFWTDGRHNNPPTKMFYANLSPLFDRETEWFWRQPAGGPLHHQLPVRAEVFKEVDQIVLQAATIRSKYLPPIVEFVVINM